jgi:hypothetical protein
MYIIFVHVLFVTPPNMGMKPGSLNIEQNKAEKFEIV